MNDRSRAGRPQATSHAAIEAAAFSLFDERGFDATTMDDIAVAVGVSRRTLFRYFPSKNDIPWGRIDERLDLLREHLAASSSEVHVLEAVHRAVMEFNRIDDDAVEQHRKRMTLILTTPALQAHSVFRYAQWRDVIAEYAASRFGAEPNELLPRTVGHISLALSLSAYEQWLREPDSKLVDLLALTAPMLRQYVNENEQPASPRSASDASAARAARRSAPSHS